MKVRKIIIKSDHVLVPLTQGKFAFIDLDDVDKVKNYNWQVREGKTTYYAIRYDCAANKLIRMHRIIMNAPLELQVDHKDHNGLNNRKLNLRLATSAQNNMNGKSRKGTSKYKGVSFCKFYKKYVAYIGFNNKKIYLGSSRDEIECAKLYDEAAKKYFGEFAYTNF